MSFISHAKVRGRYGGGGLGVPAVGREMGFFPDWSGLNEVPGTMEPCPRRGHTARQEERRQVQGWNWE